MKTIETLVDDLAKVLEDGIQEVDPKLAEKYGKLFTEMLSNRLKPREPRTKGTLRMSNIGKPCERQVYYDVNNPNDGEKLEAHTKLKFLYGDVVELLVLFLVELAGHRVEGTQDESEIAGIKGHRDAVISGTLVDVKSASSYSFEKFASGSLTSDNDSFGYITQLQSYLEDAQKDPIVTNKNSAAFLVVDKTLGHFCVDLHPREVKDYEKLYNEKKAMVKASEPPERGFTDIPEGKSGNFKLPMNCSYCSHKWTCYPDLRGFAYAGKPVYLTKVVKEPNVPEIMRDV